MSDYVWLCNYTSHSVADTYGMVVQTADFDGVEEFWLYEKEKTGHITNKEQQILEKIHIPYIKFFNSWINREFIQNLPIKLFKEPDINYSNLPKENEILFRITGSYLVINENLYNIISQFNLGKTHFSRVYIYDIETKEQISNIPYYFINIAECREFLNSNKSKGIQASSYTPNEPLRYILDAKDDDIFLSCVDGKLSVDLWGERYLNESLFFSDRLVQALFKVGFTQKELGLIRCILE